MQIISNIQEVINLCQQWHDQGKKIAFVPTMGNLHDGHLSLIAEAKNHADKVVVSIFVNPLQFGEGEDFKEYPRTLEDDVDKMSTLSPDLVFNPSVDEFYPGDEEVENGVELGELGTILEGHSRPGHFSGVVTVVKRLFEIIRPDFAIFGEKDFQQLMVIRCLIKQLQLPITLVSMPTKREQNGLAMSSRNAYLTSQQRVQAAQLYVELCAIKDKILHGKQSVTEIEAQAHTKLESLGFVPDYIVIRDASNLANPGEEPGQQVILAAVYLGKTRLIDNLRV